MHNAHIQNPYETDFTSNLIWKPKNFPASGKHFCCWELCPLLHQISSSLCELSSFVYNFDIAENSALGLHQISSSLCELSSTVCNIDIAENSVLCYTKFLAAFVNSPLLYVTLTLLGTLPIVTPKFSQPL